MANYTLSIDLSGADKAASNLDALVSKVGALGGTGGIAKTTAFKIGVTDIAKAFNQASKESAQFEKNLAKVLNFSNKVFPAAAGLFASGAKPNITMTGAGDGINPQSIFQKVADEFGKSGFASEAIKDDYRSVMKRFTDIAEPDMPEFLYKKSFYNKKIKGLAQPDYGQALAGIHQMGDITDVDKGSALGLKGTIARLAPLLSEFAAVLPVAVAGLSALAFAANEIRKAFEYGATLYSKALTGGLSTQLMAQRTIVGSVLGVPPEQINRFKQSAYVMSKLSDSINEIAKDAPALAKVSAEFKIVGFEALALSTKLANDLAPALDGLAVVLEKLIGILGSDAMIKVLTKVVPVAFGGIPALIQSMLGGKIIDVLSGIGKQDMKNSGFGSPIAMMKQLPASAWEKMGLITMGGTANYAKDTAKNTRDTVVAINRLAKYMNIPRGHNDWGMNPQTAQP